MPPYVFRSGTGHQGRAVAPGVGGSNVPHGSHLVPGLSSGYQQGVAQRDTASGGGRRIGLPSGAPVRSTSPHAAGGKGQKLTAAQRQQQAVHKFDQALSKAGVHPTPYQGGPWSIFTNGGGHLVAKVWAEELLKTIGAPVTPGNVAMVYNWQVSEGGGGKYNPLNQGPVPGQPQLTTTGQQFGGGAADFASWQAGIQGAAAYLNMPAFQGIRNALRSNNPGQARSALIASPWAASHYNGGSAFANQVPPGGSIPGLPPLSNVPVASPAGGVSPAPQPQPGTAPSPVGGTGTRAGTKQADVATPGGGPGAAPGAAPGAGAAAGASSGGGVPGTPGAAGAGSSLTGIFTQLPGSGGVETLLGTATGIGDIGNALATASNSLSTVISAVDWLFVPSHWVRIFAGVGGAASVATGVVLMSRVGGAVPTPYGSVEIPRAASLPVGMALTGFGGVLLFVAFHNLPSTVDNFPALVGYVSEEIRTGTKTAAFPPDTAAKPVAKAPVAGGILGHAAGAIKAFLDLISGGLAGLVP